VLQRLNLLPVTSILDHADPMKAKVFDVILHKLPAGRSPAQHLEAQFNNFFVQHPNIKLLGTHVNTLVVPAERNAADGTEAAESSVIIFSTLFYE